MHSFETIDLGDYRGDNYFLTGFVEPAPVDAEDFDPDEDADEFGVSLARSNPYGSNIELVRLDIAHGQRPHMDREYLPADSDEERKVELRTDYTYARMKQYLLTYWRRFADRYIELNE